MSSNEKVVFPWESAFITRMAQRRAALGMTQNELARRLKERGLPFHQQTVQRVEVGERPVRLDEAHVIAEILDTSLETMLTIYEGPLETATYAVSSIRRYASRTQDSNEESFAEFSSEFDVLASCLEEVLEAHSHKPTAEVLWVAAWVLKARWLLHKIAEVHFYSNGLTSKSGDWHESNPLPDSGFWQHTEWLESDDADIWSGVPVNERPSFLADMNPGDLQRWLEDKLDVEH